MFIVLSLDNTQKWKCKRDKTSKVLNIRYKYRRHLMLTAAV